MPKNQPNDKQLMWEPKTAKWVPLVFSDLVSNDNHPPSSPVHPVHGCLPCPERFNMLLPATLHEFNASFSGSSTSLLLSATLALLALFLLLRLAAALRKYKASAAESSKTPQPTVTQEKAPQESSPCRSPRPFWNSFSLPISFRTLETKPEIGKGPGVGSITAQAIPRLPEKIEKTPSTLPYDTQVPASAAKLIMSRHTFRKPVPGAPRRPLSASRLPLTQSMV